MVLNTINLRLSSILNELQVSSPKEIFYDNGIERTASDMATYLTGTLDPTYCSGSTHLEQCTYLVNNKRLSCFKGYSST